MKDLLTNQSVQEAKAKVLKRIVWVVTVVVLGLVVLMRMPDKIPVSEGAEQLIRKLPSLIALLNTLVAACLLAGLWSVLRKKYGTHRMFMTMALVLSAVFLLCYVTYHFTTVETKYGDIDQDGQIDEGEAEHVGSSRWVYLGILISHIVTAAVSFPMILMTFVHAWTRDFKKHKKLARWVFPLWFFVAVTGPICYWMLKPFYPS